MHKIFEFELFSNGGLAAANGWVDQFKLRESLMEEHCLNWKEWFNTLTSSFFHTDLKQQRSKAVK